MKISKLLTFLLFIVLFLGSTAIQAQDTDSTGGSTCWFVSAGYGVSSVNSGHKLIPSIRQGLIRTLGDQFLMAGADYGKDNENNNQDYGLGFGAGQRIYKQNLYGTIELVGSKIDDPNDDKGDIAYLDAIIGLHIFIWGNRPGQVKPPGKRSAVPGVGSLGISIYGEYRQGTDTKALFCEIIKTFGGN